MIEATCRSVLSDANAATTGIIVATMTSTAPIILIAQVNSGVTASSVPTTPMNLTKKLGSNRRARAETAKTTAPTRSTRAMRRVNISFPIYPAKSSGFI
jgi:hypothetical protein